MTVRRAVFLDLNGTLVQPILVKKPSEYRPVEGCASAVRSLCEAGFTCPVVTVQSRIEKGLFTELEFNDWFCGFTEFLKNEGARIEGPYVCPHRFTTRCKCSKPQTILYRRAAADLGIELQHSYCIGDTMSDVQAAIRFGGTGCLVRNAEHPVGNVGKHQAAVQGTLEEVTKWIINQGAA